MSKKKILSEQKKENRKNLILFILTAVMIKYSWGFYRELRVYEDKLGNERMKNFVIVDNSKVLREEGFYDNQNYLKNMEVLKKNWNRNAIGGINFNGSGEEK